jgi:hypothetical protein
MRIEATIERSLAFLLGRAALIGLMIGCGFILGWAILMFTRTPEPDQFLAAIRRHDGEQWAIRACADCPSFILLNRGFLSP